MHNDGGLRLPAGAIVHFPSTETFVSNGEVYEVPSIQVGEFHESSTSFTGKIFDVPEPLAPGPYLGYCTFYSRVAMLDRPFETSVITTQLVVRYPVNIREIINPTHVSENYPKLYENRNLILTFSQFFRRNYYYYLNESKYLFLFYGNTYELILTI